MAKYIMGVSALSQARGGIVGRRPPVAKQPYLGLSFSYNADFRIQ